MRHLIVRASAVFPPNPHRYPGTAALAAGGQRVSARGAAIVFVMPQFQLNPAYTATADQPKAIASLAEGLRADERFRTLLGATGTGKTSTSAGVIDRRQRTAHVSAAHKSLAGEPLHEVRDFFHEDSADHIV